MLELRGFLGDRRDCGPCALARKQHLSASCCPLLPKALVMPSSVRAEPVRSVNALDSQVIFVPAAPCGNHVAGCVVIMSAMPPTKDFQDYLKIPCASIIMAFSLLQRGAVCVVPAAMPFRGVCLEPNGFHANAGWSWPCCPAALGNTVVGLAFVVNVKTSGGDWVLLESCQ